MQNNDIYYLKSCIWLIINVDLLQNQLDGGYRHTKNDSGVFCISVKKILKTNIT